MRCCSLWALPFVLMLTLGNVLCGFDEVKVVNISIFYGTHIPECIKFMKQQLTPMWEARKLNIRLTFVPYGRLLYKYSNAEWHFDCPNGINELMSLRVHAVIADIFPKGRKHHETFMRMIPCLMGRRNHREEIENCMFLPKERLLLIRIMLNVPSCSSRAKLAELGDLTMKHFPNQRTASFPQLIFNGTYKEQDTLDSLKNFTEVVLRYTT